MMRRTYITPRLVATYLVLILYSSISLAEEDRMSFTFHPPEFSPISGTAWTIYADGLIDADAANRFDQIVRQKNIPMYSIVYLNSPGGSVIAAIELGHTFRRYGFNTSIGKFNEKTSWPSLDAYCMSSCTLAYLGDVFRYMYDNSVFGVHRFYSNGQKNNAEDEAQILSAHIIRYLNKYKINSDFFIEMSKAGPDDISILSKVDLERIGVVNNGFEKKKLSIKSIGSHNDENKLYILGEQNTQYGTNKFIINCFPNSRMTLYIIFDPQGRQDEIMTMTAQSLVVDMEYFRFTDFAIDKPFIYNGLLNVTYLIPHPLLDRIASAKTVGFIFQHSYEAPIFFGFDHLKFDDGRELFKGLRASCIN